MVWEDGFCNFAASAAEMSSGEGSGGGGGSAAYGNSDFQQYQGLQPELFFKMSHEIYNYGEGSVRIIFQQKLNDIYTKKYNLFSIYIFVYSTFSLLGFTFFVNRVFGPKSILFSNSHFISICMYM